MQPDVLPLVRDLALHGQRTALVHDGGRLSYAGLAQRVREAADRFGPVRRLVLVVGAHDVDLVVGYLGALAGGHVVLLVPEGRHVDGWVQRYDPDVVVRAAPGRGRVEQERRDGSAHTLHPDLALLLTTSGSTGSPRLVRLSRDAVQANATSIATYLGLGPHDVGVTTLPMAYCYGLSVLHSHLLSGAALVLTDLSVVDRCFWDLVRSHRVSSLAGVPYTYDLLDATDALDQDLPHLRRLLQAGGAMPVAEVRRYARDCEKRDRQLFVMYGQTEATARMAYLPPHLAVEHAGALGVPVPGGELRLADDGELVYRGPNVMMGYADGPVDLGLGRTVTELRTGDRGRRRPDGMLEVVGRTGRQVKLFGLRIDLDALQAQLHRHGVMAWCGHLDGRLVAVTEQDATVTRRALCLLSGLPRHAVQAVAVDALPRTVNGKLDGLEAERQAGAALPDPAGQDVRALYATVLARTVSGTDTFVGLGGDSLSYVEVSLRLADLLPEVPDDWPVRTVDELRRHGSAAQTRARTVPLDTTVLLRAVGILLVVASHTHLSPLLGGAHTLLAVAGYNLARFRLAALSHRASGLWRSIGRLALPTVAVVAAACLVTPGVGLVQVVQLTSLFGPDALGPAWRYWFLEALLQLLALVALLLSVPAVDRWERRHPLGLPLTLLAVGLCTRVGLVDLGPGPDLTQSAAAVLWLFALGWGAARVTGRSGRALLTVAALLLVPGFFGQRSHEAVVLVGLLLLVWRTTVPLPRVLLPTRPVLGALAAASLWVYLVQWQVLDLMVGAPRVLVLVACLVAGLLAHHAWERVVQASRTRLARTTVPRGWPPRASSRSVVTYPTSMSTWSRKSQPMLTAAAASGTEPPYALASGIRIDRNSTQPSANPAITDPVPNAPQNRARAPGLSGASPR